MGLNVVPTQREGERVTQIRFGSHGEQVLRGMRRAVAAFAREGNNVIIDDLLFKPDYLHDYAEALDGLEAWLIGVRCSLEVVNAAGSTPQRPLPRHRHLALPRDSRPRRRLRPRGRHQSHHAAGVCGAHHRAARRAARGPGRAAAALSSCSTTTPRPSTSTPIRARTP
jgi:hypothetical protein